MKFGTTPPMPFHRGVLIIITDEPRPIKLLKMALPIIQKFIKEELSKSGGTSDADVSSA